MANELTYQSVFTGQEMDERFTAVAQLQAALLEVETALSAKYVKPASGIPETDLDSAVQSALAKARSAVQDLSNYYTKTEIDSLLAAVNSQEYVDVAALPTASASTLGKIYLVGPTNNQYDRYYTSYDGSDYSWVAAGSTEINLSNYATKAELNQLDQKVVKIEPQIIAPAQQVISRDNIGVPDAIYGRVRNYEKNARTYNGALLVLSGVGTTDFIPVALNDSVVWKFGGTGSSDIRLEIFGSDKVYIGGYSSSAYTDIRTVSITDATWAYMRVSFRLTLPDGSTNSSPVSVNGNNFVIRDEVGGYSRFVKGGELNEELRWKPLPLGGLLNCDTDSNGHLRHHSGYDSLRVTTKSNICLPFPGCKIRARIPDGLTYMLQFYLWIGTAGGDHTLFSTIFYNGTVATLPKTALTVRPVFRAWNTNASALTVPINASDIQAMIDNGTLAIEYYDDSTDGVVERNVANMANLAAIRRKLVATMADNSMDSMPVFAHITDLHGDAPRWQNFLDFCDSVGVDFAIESGDATLNLIRDASHYIYDFANIHNTEVLACIGNHEASPTGSATLFADNLADLATKYEYLASSGTETTKCYYYKDYDAKKVRVIALNQHEDGVYSRRIGQAQVDWFIATLLSTPAGYGIVITYHAPEDKVVADSPYDVFRQPMPNTGATYEPNGAYVGDRPIMKLIDAFISRTSVNFTYDDHSATYNGDSDTTMQTVSVVADFSEVDESTEFLCYVCGHRHEDWIGYYDHATNKQLCLCITCANSLYADSTNPYWSNQSDLPRGGHGVEQDAFCVYAIDRVGGNVKVMRVGATVTEKMVKREMMVIPYKDSES